MKVRDTVHVDGAVAGSPEQLGEVEIGDIRFFSILEAESCAGPRDAGGKN